MKKISLLVLVALLAFTFEARCSTLSSIQEAILVAKGDAEYNDYNDSSPFSILYNGAAGATMTIAGLTLTITGADYVSLDLSDTLYDTEGEVYDLLVSTHSGIYTVVDVDMRRAGDTSNLGEVATQAIWSSAYNVLYDTGGPTGVGTAGTTLFTQIALTPSSGKRIRLFRVIGNADVASIAGTDAISIFKEDAISKAETQVWHQIIVTDEVDLAVTFTTNNPYGGLDFGVDERVVIRTTGDESQDAGAGTAAFYIEW